MRLTRLTEDEMDGMDWAEMLINKDGRPMIQAYWDRQKEKLRTAEAEIPTTPTNEST